MNVALKDVEAIKRDLRKAVLEVADTPLPSEYTSKLVIELGNLFLKKIDEAPLADAAPVRHGYWIPQDSTRTKFMCSDCKTRNHDGSGKWCSTCGCKMDAEV